MNIDLILDAAEAEADASALRALATEILASTTRSISVLLGAADILLCRGKGTPAVHLTVAAGQLLDHLAAIEGTALEDQGTIMVLIGVGADADKPDRTGKSAVAKPLSGFPG